MRLFYNLWGAIELCYASARKGCIASNLAPIRCGGSAMTMGANMKVIVGVASILAIAGAANAQPQWRPLTQDREAQYFISPTQPAGNLTDVWVRIEYRIYHLEADTVPHPNVSPKSYRSALRHVRVDCHTHRIQMLEVTGYVGSNLNVRYKTMTEDTRWFAPQAGQLSGMIYQQACAHVS